MVDYISYLPKEVIGNILTRLPTREAVQTLLLRKNWAEKWTYITSVSFDDEATSMYDSDADGVWIGVPGNIHESRFLSFMYETLRGVRKVLNFTLVLWQGEYEVLNVIGSSIDTAFQKKVQKAEIKYMSDNTLARLPPSVLHCRSLEDLSLRQFEAMIPIANVFPYLKRLDLDHVVFLNESPEIDTMSITFPVLEQCAFSLCSWLNIKFMELIAPKLIGAHFYTRKDRKPHVDGCTIRIIGAKFEEFNVFEGYPGNFDLRSTSIVERALVDGEPNEGNDALQTCGIQLRKLLKQFTGLKELWLSGNSTEAIANTKQDTLYRQGYEHSADYEYFRWPMCHHLESLYVGEHVHKEGLLELLGWTPNLKLLHVDWNPVDETWNLGAFDQFERPSCIVNNLEKVEFEEFNGVDKQYELIEYLLQHGAKLKSFVINITSDEILQMEIIVDLIQSYHRASNEVQIWLDGAIVV